MKRIGKIDEFEKKLIKRGMTVEDLNEYQKLLKRVRGNFLKRQHCYTTAIQFPKKYADQAIKLIQFGLDNFEDGWFTTYTSYLYIGHIYEENHNYFKAYESYLRAKEALGTNHINYVQELSKDLMWMKLHIDSFNYSAILEEYLSCYKKCDDFSKSFVNSEFRVVVTNIVICIHYDKMNEAKQFLERAKEICRPNFVGKLFNILVRHNYRESLKTTPESINYIRGHNL